MLKFKNIAISLFYLFLAAPVLASSKFVDAQKEAAARKKVNAACSVIFQLDSSMEHIAEKTQEINEFFCFGYFKKDETRERFNDLYGQLDERNESVTSQMDDLDPLLQALNGASLDRVNEVFEVQNIDRKLKELRQLVKNSMRQLEELEKFKDVPDSGEVNPVDYAVAVQKKKKKVRPISKKALRARLRGGFLDLQMRLGVSELDFLPVKADDETRNHLDKRFRKMLRSCELNLKKINSRKPLELASLNKMRYQATVYEKFLKKASNCKSWCQERVQAFREKLETDPNYEAFDSNGNHKTTSTDLLKALLKKDHLVMDQAK